MTLRFAELRHVTSRHENYIFRFAFDEQMQQNETASLILLIKRKQTRTPNLLNIGLDSKSTK